MDKLSSIITVGSLILAGVLVMVNMPPQVGIVILIFAVVFGLLAIPNWGPLRKYWESKPSRIFTIEYLGHSIHTPVQEGEALGIMVEVGFTVTPTTRIESVVLHLQGEPLPSDWKPRSIGGAPEKRMVHFKVPDWVKPGAYSVKLVALASGKKTESSSFPITLPK